MQRQEDKEFSYAVNSKLIQPQETGSKETLNNNKKSLTDISKYLERQERRHSAPLCMNSQIFNKTHRFLFIQLKLNVLAVVELFFTLCKDVFNKKLSGQQLGMRYRQDFWTERALGRRKAKLPASHRVNRHQGGEVKP